MIDTIQINRIHYPITVLGPGNRIGIWLQGCSLGCQGCQSRDTWPADAGMSIPVSKLVEVCRRWTQEGIDGITISGGEPFEQPKELANLLQQLHAWTDQSTPPIDYLCYSGKSFNVIQRDYPDILRLLDTLIPEPFVEDLPVKPLRGSNNQPIIHLSELGKVRFAEYAENICTQPEKRMQFLIDGNTIWFIGIPERGDLDRLTELCKRQGLQLKNVSWHKDSLEA